MNYSSTNITTPAASTTSHRLTSPFEMCVYSINFLFGLPTHSYIIWLIVARRGSGIASDICHVNLSICEIGNAVNGLFVALSFWVSGLATLVQFLTGLLITGRPLFQCLICVERYLAVIHPVTFLKYKPLRYRLICCTVVWLISFGSCLFCMFILGAVNMKTYRGIILLQFFIFLSIQLFCCLTVLRALKQSGPGERERGDENHMKRRAFHLILISIVNMAIVYVPFAFTVASWAFRPGLRFRLLLCLCSTPQVLFPFMGLGRQPSPVPPPLHRPPGLCYFLLFPMWGLCHSLVLAHLFAT
ncbi:C-C chemokine receptor type 8-like [Triplophysa dalaica]|uniref:C-C chemokine receptor type 8-like n=1 Tax=Triplophysa dalaica TaxID=1582913 RepID=UPI0024DFC175|nr:C-C chemokine receptor type 8-like [Triplophysa dalaica]